jgi:hypothetical protein
MLFAEMSSISYVNMAHVYANLMKAERVEKAVVHAKRIRD